MSFKKFYGMHVLSGCVDFLISLALLFVGFCGFKFVSGFMEGARESKKETEEPDIIDVTDQE